jgi:hypothetical protein
VPTNFDPTPLGPDSTPRTVLDCGESVFDSTSSTFTNWCGQAEPRVATVTPSGGSELVVLGFQGLDIAPGSTLRLVGTRPVVVAVFGDTTIAGTLNASANGVTAGAGGNQTCGSSAGVNGTGSSSSGGGGGGGGGFGAKGGDGGNGDSSNNFGTGGVARGAETLSPLLGGCAGGRGGGCTTTPDGGGGGGAVQIAAAGILRITGAVLSNGGQGVTGCGSEGGGTGGGSGGAILLEGDVVDVAAAAQVTANGGRGGNGRNGGSGGLGGTATSAAQNGQNHGSNGGGGGGGAVGRIRVNAASSCTLAGAISPAASRGC